ncbi:hypothetical protein MHYP_G00327560 [Metynnis hypsauchen]
MGKCRFNAKWLEDEKYCGWLKPSSDSCEARCELCRKTFKLGTMGCKALDSHMKSEKHKRYDGARKSNMHIESFAAIGGLTVSAKNDLSTVNKSVPAKPSGPATGPQTPFSTFSTAATLKAEVLWVLHTISRHHSYTSNDDIHTVFRGMFPDSELAKTFTCGRDKTAYLVRFGLAPYIKKQLISRVNEDSFVIMFDESLNRTTKNKQLDLHVRYWTTDETGTHVQSRFFGSQFMGHSTADDLLERFKEGTKELKLKNMVSLSMDGPNVNWKLVELIQKEYGEQFAGAQLEIVGSCGLHTLHNSFKSGFLMWQIEKVLRALHSLFNCAPARREDFSSATKSSVFPLPFCGHRWLENLPAIERAVEVWPSIVKYVDLVKTKKLPNPGSSSYDTIAVARMDPLLLAKFHFFMAISRVFQPFLTKYQTDAPMMPFLWNDLENLIKLYQAGCPGHYSIQTCEA